MAKPLGWHHVKKQLQNGHIQATHRIKQIIINRAKIGHSNMNHSYLITKEPSTTCDTNNIRPYKRTHNHQLPQLTSSRHLFNNYTSLKTTPPII